MIEHLDREELIFQLRDAKVDIQQLTAKVKSLNAHLDAIRSALGMENRSVPDLIEEIERLKGIEEYRDNADFLDADEN